MTTSQPVLRIATRKSPLALWQAHHIKALLEQTHPGIQVEILGFVTEGDKLLATPLAQIGGKGLFVKELEKAMLDGRADIAVHSIKDMPAELPADLILAAITEREDVRDAFVSNQFDSIATLPAGAVVGTSSSRRTCQLKILRPDLRIENLRGNVGTRLEKLDGGAFDAIILAAAGLKRLGATQRIRDYLDPVEWVPAPGQGAIGIECRAHDTTTIQLLSAIEHIPTRICITAERAMNRALGGGCQLPIGAYAALNQNQLVLHGLVGDLQNAKIVRASIEGVSTQAEVLGKDLAHTLLQQGAAALLK